ARAEAEGCWCAGAAAGVDINARRRLVRAAARRAGDPRPDLPPPVSITGRTLAEILTECRQTAERIEAMKVRLEEKWRRRAVHLLDASAGTSPGIPRPTWLRGAQPDTAAPDAGGPATPAPLPAGHVPAVAAATPGSQDVAAEIESWLAKLDREAEPDDLRQALDAAERASQSPNLWLVQLGRTVQRINAKLDKRRRQAPGAAAHPGGLAGGGPGPGHPRGGRGVQRPQRVAGETDLTESLRDEAHLLIAEWERVARTRDLTAKIRALLEEGGFDVQADFDLAGHPYDPLKVAWPGRPDHSAYIRVDGDEISH